MNVNAYELEQAAATVTRALSNGTSDCHASATKPHRRCQNQSLQTPLRSKREGHVPVFEIYGRAAVKLEVGVVENGLPIPDAPLSSTPTLVVSSRPAEQNRS